MRAKIRAISSSLIFKIISTLIVIATIGVIFMCNYNNKPIEINADSTDPNWIGQYKGVDYTTVNAKGTFDWLGMECYIVPVTEDGTVHQICFLKGTQTASAVNDATNVNCYYKKAPYSPFSETYNNRQIEIEGVSTNINVYAVVVNATLNNLGYIFEGASNLHDIIFDTNSKGVNWVKTGDDPIDELTFWCAFENTSGIETIDMQNFDVSGAKIKHMNCAFKSSAVSNIIMPDNFDGQYLIDLTETFMETKNLTTIDLSKFNTTRELKYTKGMFHQAIGTNLYTSLTSLTFPDTFNTSGVTDASSMFENCEKLIEIHFGSGCTFSSCTNFSNMFTYTKQLSDLDLSTFDLTQFTDDDKINMNYMFSFTEIKIRDTVPGSTGTLTFGEKFDTSHVTSMEGMFYTSLYYKELDLSKFNTKKVKTAKDMFAHSKGGGFKIKFGTDSTFENCENFDEMFYDCTYLASSGTLDVSMINTQNALTAAKMFAGLITVNYIKFGTNSTFEICEDFSYMFAQNGNLIELNLSTFITSSATNMSGMFNDTFNNSVITELDVSNFNTSSVTNMKEMFASSAGEKDNNGIYKGIFSIKFGDNFTFDACNNYKNMFYNRKRIKTLDLSKVDFSRLTSSNSDNVLDMLANESSIHMIKIRNNSDAVTGLDVSLGHDDYHVATVDSETGIVTSINRSSVSTITKGTGVTTFVRDNHEYDVNDTCNICLYYNPVIGTYNSHEYFAGDAVAKYDWLGMKAYIVIVNDDGTNKQVCFLTNTQNASIETLSSQKESDAYYEKAPYAPYNATYNNRHFLVDGVDTEIGVSTLVVNATLIDMSNLFANATNINDVTFPDTFNTAGLINVSGLFTGCSNLTSITWGNNCTFNDTTDFSNMFSSCSKLTDLDLSKFDTSSAETVAYMFSGCSSLKTITLGTNCNFKNCTDFSYMFNECNALTDLDLNLFDLRNIEDSINMKCMFNDTTIKADTVNVPSSTGTLTFGDNFDTKKVNSMESMFNGFKYGKKLDLSKFNTLIVETAEHMFDGANENSFDIEFGEDCKFDSCTNLSYMFNNCSTITSLDISMFDLSKGTSVDNMFNQMSSLNSIKIPAKVPAIAIALPTNANGWVVTDADDERLDGDFTVLKSKENYTNGTYMVLNEDEEPKVDPTPQVEPTTRTITTSIAVQFIDHEKIMEGYEDKTFKPNKNITREEVTKILSLLDSNYNENMDYTSYLDGVTDVKKTSWSANYLGYMISKNVISPESNKIRPTENVTRAEVAKMICALKQFESYGKTSSFKDSNGHWYDQYVGVLEDKNIIEGYNDQTFKGTNNMTRAEFAKVITVASGRNVNKNKVTNNIKQSVVNMFKDLNKNGWYIDYIAEVTIDHSISYLH